MYAHTQYLSLSSFFARFFVFREGSCGLLRACLQWLQRRDVSHFGKPSNAHWTLQAVAKQAASSGRDVRSGGHVVRLLRRFQRRPPSLSVRSGNGCCEGGVLAYFLAIVATLGAGALKYVSLSLDGVRLSKGGCLFWACWSSGGRLACWAPPLARPMS